MRGDRVPTCGASTAILQILRYPPRTRPRTMHGQPPTPPPDHRDAMFAIRRHLGKDHFISMFSQVTGLDTYVLAGVLGAPFWFAALNKVVNLLAGDRKRRRQTGRALCRERNRITVTW